MARPTINDIRSISDVVMNNSWDVSLESPAGVTFDSGDLNFRALSSTIPKRTGESQEMKIRGQKIKIPGDYDYEGTIELVAFETEDMKVSKMIKAWREAIKATKTNEGLPKSEVETTMVLRRLAKDGSVIATYVLYGVYLEDYDMGSLNETAELSQITLTLSYDYFEDDYV